MYAIGTNKAYLCHVDIRKNYISKTLKMIKEHNKLGLQFKTHLRDINGKNVLLCCSREDGNVDVYSIDTPVVIG